MTQCSLALSAGQDHWFLINASPDLRSQINGTPALHPRDGHMRHSPIAGVILTNGEIDAIAGLLSLRENAPFTIYAHEIVLKTLADNSIFNVLSSEQVRRERIEAGQTFTLKQPDSSGSDLTITPFTVPGKQALYTESDASAAAVTRDTGETLGLKIKTADGKTCFVITACAEITAELAAMLADADLVFFDGTLWRDDELIAAGLSRKTGRRMGHVSISGMDGVMDRLDGLGIRQKCFLHINNSNPVLMPGSPQRLAVEARGWRIPHDGMEIQL